MSVMGEVMNLRDLAIATSSMNSPQTAVVELMTKACPLLEDMAFVQGNLPTGHKFTIRTALPKPTFRRLYEGVKPTRSTTRTITEDCAMLEATCEIDAKHLELMDNKDFYRIQEAWAHIEGMTQEFSDTLWYGDNSVNPEKFTGFAKRYGSLSGEFGKYIIDAGGTGPNLQSVWFMVWSPYTLFGIVPKNSKAGVQHFKGEIQDIVDPDNQGTYRGYRDRFQWDCGLVVKDPRYVVRIANIDMDALKTFGTPTDTSPNLVFLLNEATNLVQSTQVGRPVFYMSRDMRQEWEHQLLKSSYIIRTPDEATGKLTEKYKGFPYKIDDTLVNEDKVV